MDIDDRPTLEEQIAISNLTYEECMEVIKPHGWKKLDFLMLIIFFNHKVISIYIQRIQTR